MMVVGLIIVFAGAALAIVWDGYVLFILWGWFVVPIFGLPALTVSQAIGVSLIAGLLAHQYYETPDGKIWERIAFMFSHPTAILLIGWIVKQWSLA